MSAVSIISVVKVFFKDLDLPLRNARFACMNSINVNPGARNGLKCHLEHSVPMLQWIRCNNQKLALCFKHLIPQFPTISKLMLFC